MNEGHAERIVRLLEEIRDGQRIQLERQAEALQIQKDVIAMQRDRLAGIVGRSGQAHDLLTKSAQVVASARVIACILVPLAIVFLGFLVWALFGARS